MPKLVLSDLVSLTNEQSAVSTINANSALIETALEKTLSRDGTAPNTMGADLDMNSNQIINLPDPVDDTDVVRLVDLEEALTANSLRGEKGDAATIAVGTVTSTAAGTNPTVVNGGTSSAAVFNFTIPKGGTVGVPYLFSTTTTDSDPGNGNVRFNNATVASVTQIYFDNQSESGASTTAWLDSFDDSTTATPKGFLYGLDTVTNTIQLVFSVTGTIVDGTGYRKVPVTHILGTTLPAATDRIVWIFVRTGDKGTDGAGTGDVVGPASSVSGRVVTFNGTTGKLIQDGGTLLSALAIAARSLTAGSGLTGGGDLTADRTFNVGAGTGITVNADDVQIATAYQALGKQTVWVPAVAMITRTTNGAAAGTVETTTNKVMLKTLDFDTTTQEFVQFGINMPKSWNEGTVTFQPVWSHAATTTNFGVVWGLEAVALSDDDAADAAFGTAQTSTDTGGTTNDIYIGPESSAITIAGTPAENDYVVFQVKRLPADGSDTMAIDARLHGVRLFYTTNAANDA